MKNLVMTAAVGLDPKAVEFFIKSLRRFYEDEVYFLVGRKDYDLKKKLKSYNSKFYQIDDHRYDVQLNRYKYFLEILKKNDKFKQIFICDCRDLYFQSNPFNYRYKGSINFFSEDISINQCPINSKWIYKTFGKKIYKSISDNAICCSGTVLGSPDSMIDYLNLMNSMIVKYPFRKSLKYLLTFRRDKEGRGCDQGYCNFIVHTKCLNNSFLYSNHEGPIATVFYLKKIKFNEKSELLNNLGQAYSVVHQYDKRWSEFSEKVNLIKKNLNSRQ
jgi:hypothetical protein